MKIEALSAFSDNYIWMIHDDAQALVVDPGDAAPVLGALRDRGLKLSGILLTHHHPDHVGGVQDLRGVLEGSVHGPAEESMPQPCVPLREGDQVHWRGARFDVLDVPGHTAGHIAYVGTLPDQADPVLLCGDTLFSAGCGRLFEGTPAQMASSLDKLAQLPESTQVCCAHEYTLSNLRFAAAVEPANDDVARHTRHCQQTREAGRPTLPSTIGLERRINPFLRCTEPAVKAAVAARCESVSTPVDVLAALRQWKNAFR
jgi:hydroxyacylglutathione hydrolase